MMIYTIHYESDTMSIERRISLSNDTCSSRHARQGISAGSHTDSDGAIGGGGGGEYCLCRSGHGLCFLNLHSETHNSLFGQLQFVPEVLYFSFHLVLGRSDGPVRFHSFLLDWNILNSVTAGGINRDEMSHQSLGSRHGIEKIQRQGRIPRK